MTSRTPLQLARTTRGLKLLCIILPGVATSSHADTLRFVGIALPTCAMTAPVDGTITLQPDLMSWATTTPATIAVTNTAPATVTVTRASAWQSSPAGTPSTTFNHSATISGVNLGTMLGAGDSRTGVLTALGVNQVAVALSATASSPFKAGTHVAEVTVTCSVP